MSLVNVNFCSTFLLPVICKAHTRSPKWAKYNIFCRISRWNLPQISWRFDWDFLHSHEKTSSRFLFALYATALMHLHASYATSSSSHSKIQFHNASFSFLQPDGQLSSNYRCNIWIFSQRPLFHCRDRWTHERLGDVPLRQPCVEP